MGKSKFDPKQILRRFVKKTKRKNHHDLYKILSYVHRPTFKNVPCESNTEKISKR